MDAKPPVHRFGGRAAARLRPMRGGTKPLHTLEYRTDISIHAPHTGRDSKNAQKGLRILGKADNFSCFSGKNAASRGIFLLNFARFSAKTRCEPPGRELRAQPSHQMISESSER